MVFLSLDVPAVPNKNGLFFANVASESIQYFHRFCVGVHTLKLGMVLDHYNSLDGWFSNDRYLEQALCYCSGEEK